MPTVIIEKGYRYFFYSNEGIEPPHIHIAKDNKYAKLWLNPIRLDKNYKFSVKEINYIVKYVKHNSNFFKEKWHEHFSKA